MPRKGPHQQIENMTDLKKIFQRPLLSSRDYFLLELKVIPILKHFLSDPLLAELNIRLQLNIVLVRDYKTCAINSSLLIQLG